MKKILKYLLILIILLVVGAFITVKVISEALPQGEPGPKAEQLAKEVLLAINDPALDSTKWLQWEFMSGRRYIWDIERNMAQITWGPNKVVMQLDTQTGNTYINNKVVTDQEKVDLLKGAWDIWCNDSFWMIAPNKIFDPGTSRSIVDVSDEFPNSKGLLIEYKSGGVTPGDAYLWILGPDNIPTGYKMWTSIIPIKGIYTSWEDWIILYSGAKVATTHKASIGGFSMKDVKSGASWSDLGLDKRPF